MVSLDRKRGKRDTAHLAPAPADRELEPTPDDEWIDPWSLFTEAEEQQQAKDEEWARLTDPRHTDPDRNVVRCWYEAKAREQVQPGTGSVTWEEVFRPADRELAGLHRGNFDHIAESDRQERLQELARLSQRAVILDVTAARLGCLLDWHFADAPLTFSAKGPCVIPEAEAELAGHPAALVAVNAERIAGGKSITPTAEERQLLERRFGDFPDILGSALADPQAKIPQIPWPLPPRDPGLGQGVADADLARQFVNWGAGLPDSVQHDHFRFAEACLVRLDADATAPLPPAILERLTVAGLFHEADAALRRDVLRTRFKKELLDPWRRTNPVAPPDEAKRNLLLAVIRETGYHTDPADIDSLAADLQGGKVGGRNFREETGKYLYKHIARLTRDCASTGQEGRIDYLRDTFDIRIASRTTLTRYENPKPGSKARKAKAGN